MRLAALLELEPPVRFIRGNGDREGAARRCALLLLGPDVRLRRTTYDLVGAAARARRTAYPQAEEFASTSVLHPPSEDDMLAAFARAELA